MKPIALASMLVLAAPALAAEAPAGQAEDPMGGWKPRKVQAEAKDRKEIMALFARMDAASRKGDLEAAAAIVHFPVLMITDDSKGQAYVETWTRARWTEVMKPFYEKPVDMKVKHQPTIFLMTDSLASVDDVVTFGMGGKTMTSRNSTLLVRVDGAWRIAAMVEGGWGDMMAQHSHAGGQQPGASPQK
jgi:hypothetical protein